MDIDANIAIFQKLEVIFGNKKLIKIKREMPKMMLY